MNAPKFSTNPLIKYCPACGKETFRPHSKKSFFCTACDFTLFLNAAAAVAAIIESEGDILLVVRGSEPGQGLLDLPGGFVDYYETAEAALARELKEELGLDLSTNLSWDKGSIHSNPEKHICSLVAHYIGSYPNTYSYKNVNYETTDLFYHILLELKPALEAHDDVSGFIWVPRNAIPMDKLAFPSGRYILTGFQKNLGMK